MTTKTNNADGGTNGTAVTTGNSGGASGTAWDVVSYPSGNVTYDTASARHGALGYKFAPASGNQAILRHNGFSSLTGVCRGYWTIDTLPAGNEAIIGVSTAASANIFQVAVGSGGSYMILDATFAFVSQTTATKQAGDRVEVSWTIATSSTGSFVLKLFRGDSTTATETLTGSAVNFGSTAWGFIDYGKASTTTWTSVVHADDFYAADGTTTLPGPAATAGAVTAVAAVGTEAAVAPAVDGTAVVSGGGPAVGSGMALAATTPAGSASVAPRAATGTGTAIAPSVGRLALFVATADPTNSPPRVVLSVSAAAGTAVTIRRVDQQGNSATVRSANPATLTSGGWVGFDYEAPYGQPVTYTATTDATSKASLTAAVELDVTQSWLIHPGIPSLSVPLEVAAQPVVSRPTGRSLFTVLGRDVAVARSDGQRKARTFDLTIRTYTAEDEDNLDTLLDDDSVLLLQITDPRIYRGLRAWVSVGDVTQTPMATYREGYLEWTLPCVEAARPSGLLQSQNTWADVIATYATWADVLAAYASWRDVITDTVAS